MKVLVPLQGPSLDALVDPRFGRAPFYAVVDSNSPEEPEILPNPYVFYPSAPGVAAAQLAIQKGVNAVVAPAVGPNASMVLTSAGIKVIPFAGFTGRDALKNLGETASSQQWQIPSEENFIQSQISALEAQINHLKARLEELKKKKEEK